MRPCTLPHIPISAVLVAAVDLFYGQYFNTYLLSEHFFSSSSTSFSPHSVGLVWWGGVQGAHTSLDEVD